jgi:hypothetical protein
MSAEPNIVVEPLGWPMDGLKNPPWHVNRVRLVASSSASSLWRFCEPRNLAPIVVYPRKEGPLCDFKHDSRGRARVGLNVKPNRYDQLAFQFAHEFCHVMAIHSRVGQRHDVRHSNHWLEESLCETASLFALRKMTSEWEQHSEFSTWETGDGKPYSPSHQVYAQKRIDSALLRLPSEQGFQPWFEGRHQFLRDHPIAIEKDKQIEAELREDYTVIATRLLPLLEANPENWEAISFLNLTQHKDGKLLAEHLEGWKAVCPEKYRQFVGSIERTFVPSAVSNP